MRTPSILCFVLLMGVGPAAARGERADDPKPDADESPRLSKDVQAFLEQAGQLDVYSLDPDQKGEDRKDGFHGFKMLGKTTVKGAGECKKLIDLIEKGIAEGPGPAGCFHPRHGVRATHDGKTVDLVICFECVGIEVFNGDDKSFVYTSAAPQEAIDKVLRAAGVPLAPKPK